ncbi:putative DNA repair protein Pso2/Snm1 [Tirmania nivea]|nr:putative DNA repair protein Pso2/Snm1 [Tirmania nivea]
MAPPRSRKPKPRQTALSFPLQPAGTSNSSSQPTSRRQPAGGNRPRKRPNASILNFFQKVPRGARSVGDGLFVEGEYNDDDLYSGGPVAEVRDEMADEELMGLFEEETAVVAVVDEGADQGRGRRGGSVMFPTPVKPEEKKPGKGPFMMDDEDESSDEGNTPTKPTNVVKRETVCSQPSPPPPMLKKRKMPFELEEDEDEEEDARTRGSNARLNKYETNLSPPVLTNGAGSSTLNDTAAASFIDDEFIDDELLNNDDDEEGIDSLNGDGWEEREEGRYLEMLQEQESARMQDENDTLQCPICSESLEGMKEDEATRHVNHCLDGGVETPLTPGPSAYKYTTPLSPVPASTPSKPSAFTHLMTSLTESRLWVTAAASEALRNSTRQRRSSLTRALEPTTTITAKYDSDTPQPQPPSSSRRPCPFYKLIFPHPVSVAMDAFKYGAIPGVDAYFLSHFHSDHYGGLTSTWSHGLIWCTKVTANLVRQKLGVNGRWVREVEWGVATYVGGCSGNGSGGETLWVHAIPANHCPGSAIFLFERRRGSEGGEKILERVLHTGDFRAAPWMLRHPLLSPYIDIIDPQTGKKKRKEQWIDTIYLDTTYLNPRYTFPRQSAVVNLCAEMCVGIDSGDENWSMRGKAYPRKGLFSAKPHKAATTEQVSSSSSSPPSSPHPLGTLLVVIGTYSIGKERLCISIALALDSKIYAPRNKLTHLSTCLESPLLTSLLTSDPLAAQVHMVPLMEIRPDVLSEYLTPLRPAAGGRFTRVIGFRPTGWTYKPAKGTVIPTPISAGRRRADAGAGVGWAPPPEPPFTPVDLAPARGSTDVSACYAVPYSEHSSFRELACFVCGVNATRVIPTVNVAREAGRKAMGGWVERWKRVAERRRTLGREEDVGVREMGSGWEWEEKEGEGGEEGMFMGEGGGRTVFMGQRGWVGDHAPNYSIPSHST